MSFDGAIDKPRSSRPVRGDDRGVGQIALVVLLALALVATVVMIFSENPVWMRIGTLAALWAAFIGAFLVGRYKRQAATEAARVRDLHTVYELQLEREISARREHELVVEKDLRDSIRSETSDSIYALRHEIAALREQLGQLGVTFPEDRIAVGGHAPAGELGAGQTLPSVPSERVAPRRRAPEPTRPGTDESTSSGWDPAPAPAPSTSTAPSPVPSTSTSGDIGSSGTAPGVGRDATPSTERTEKLAAVEHDDAPAREQRGPAVKPRTRKQSTAEPAKAAKSESSRSESSQSEPSQSEPATSESSETGSAATEESHPSRHGSGGGLSVADLMARLGGDGDPDAPPTGRRHRRAQD